MKISEKSNSDKGFTEFYLLDSNGGIGNYPDVITFDQGVIVSLCIVNHEQTEKKYKISMVIDGILTDIYDSIILADQQKWECPVTFNPNSLGVNQKIEFYLYINGNDTPNLKLQLWLDVLNS